MICLYISAKYYQLSEPGPGAEERVKITKTAMPIFQKIFVGEMDALDMEAMGAYYAAMAR